MLTVSTLDIVIVNWNSGIQLRDCLVSIAAANIQGISLEKVIVVDNGSSDGSLERVEEIDLPLLVIRNRCNYGFSRACNQGAESGTSSCILFLNPDIRLFEKSLVVPVKFLERYDQQNVGIVGIQLIEGSGEISKSCARFPEPKMMFAQMIGLDRIFPKKFPAHFLKEWNHKEKRSVDQVMGAFFMVRRKLFEKLNGFDERFFVYYEDLDLSLRAKKAGYSSWFVPDVAAFHRGCGTSDQVIPERLFYYLRSRILYGFKHFGRMQATLLMMATLFCEPAVRLALAFSHGSGKDFSDTLKGFLMLFMDVPGLVRKKDKKQRTP